MTNRAEKIRKIRTLAERGATEGERAAAREALKRMGADEHPGARGAVPNGLLLHGFNRGFGDISYDDLNDIISKLFNGAVITINLSDLKKPKTSDKASHHGRVHFDV